MSRLYLPVLSPAGTDSPIRRWVAVNPSDESDVTSPPMTPRLRRRVSVGECPAAPRKRRRALSSAASSARKGVCGSCELTNESKSTGNCWRIACGMRLALSAKCVPVARTLFEMEPITPENEGEEKDLESVIENEIVQGEEQGEEKSND